MRKFFSSKTGTADKYAHVSSVSFPAMTVCPPYPYDGEALERHGTNRTALQWGAHWVSNRSGVTPAQFYREVVVGVEELVRSVDVYSEEEVGGTNILGGLAPNDSLCGEALFSVKEYYYNGDCFSFEPPRCLREAGVLEMVMDFHDKVDIFIHHPGQFLNPNSR